MCLAVPGKVVEILAGDSAFRVGDVDFSGVRKRISLAFTPEVVAGDFVLVHVGFAITRIDAEEAQRTYEYLAHIGALREEGLDEEGFGEEGVEQGEPAAFDEAALAAPGSQAVTIEPPAPPGSSGASS